MVGKDPGRSDVRQRAAIAARLDKMRRVSRFFPGIPALRLVLGRKSGGACGPKIAVGLGRMDEAERTTAAADRALDALSDFPPEMEEADPEFPPSPGARGFGGSRLVRRREAAPALALLASSVQAVLRYAATARVRLPQRIPRLHVASFVSGILLGVLGMQFVGSGESAELTTVTATQSVPSPAAVSPPAALPSPGDVPPPTSREKAVESPRAAEISRTTETRGAGAATHYQGGLRIDSQPAGATVFINNQQVGHTPIVLHSLRAGSRAVRIQLGGYAPWSRSVRVVANQQATVLAQLEPSR